MESFLNFSSNNARGKPPPSYEEAVDPNAPPPSYDSLFGRVREAQRTSSGILELLKKLLTIILGTIGCTIIVGVTIVIPLSMIVMGSIYLFDCPQAKYIPVYLLIGGTVGILKQLLYISSRIRLNGMDEDQRVRRSSTQSSLNCFLLGFFIIGTALIYKEYEPNYDRTIGDSSEYCNENLYIFAFWLITSTYLLVGIVSICLCAFSLITVLYNSTCSCITVNNEPTEC